MTTTTTTTPHTVLPPTNIQLLQLTQNNNNNNSVSANHDQPYPPLSSAPTIKGLLNHRHELTPAPSPLPSPNLPPSSQHHHHYYYRNYQLSKSISPQLPPLRLHLSLPLSMEGHRYRPSSYRNTPLLASTSLSSSPQPQPHHASLPLPAPIHLLLEDQPPQASVLHFPTQILLSHESPHNLQNHHRNAERASNHQQHHHHHHHQQFQKPGTRPNPPPPPPPTLPVLLPHQPTQPRKRGRKSKQDLLLNRVSLTDDQKKVNHMHAEQRRRTLVRSSLLQLSQLVPGMKHPIEGDGANPAANCEGSSRVEILEGTRLFVEKLKRRNALLKAQL
ncbi:hypothetical protein CcCBS67573_g02378 [Chytriomyces confervae]|uniref:BHLH domain-containing protein n=1 Tax=Chytriomyces confervae TaxID=246404 RepID=A0A507FL34_9FUNG|nr:hypothetical protein CcCBS67573_g02378 [Chytriomyces confervae]